MGFRTVYMVEMLDEYEEFFSVCVCETKEDAEHFVNERGYVKASDNSKAYRFDTKNAHRCGRGLIFCDFEDCPVYLEWVDRVGEDIQMIVNTYPCEDAPRMCAPEEQNTTYFIREFEMYERD